MTFEERYSFPNITTNEKVEEYEASQDIFASLLSEVKELSKKKPDAIMNAGKVKIVNRVLENLLKVLEGQPDAKYLDVLNDDDLPQVSDAVLVMVQFKSALDSYKSRHYKGVVGHGMRWITFEFIEKFKSEYDEQTEEDDY